MDQFAPAISQFMTPTPYTIGPESRLLEALQVMELYHIHHLPVISEKKLVGLLSLGDLRLIGAHAPEAFATIAVEKLMSRNPYCVKPETALSTVTQHMAERRLNATLVIQEDGSLIGIFTDADAIAAFAQYLHGRWRPGAESLLADDASLHEEAHRPLPRI